jgi:hypothetical protein
LCAAATTFLFSGAIDYPVESQFRKDPSGGLVFLLLGPRENGYFVASKREEERKKRSDRSSSYGADKPADMPNCLPSWFRVTLQ